MSQTRRQWRLNTMRGMLTGVVLLFDYALMLVVMTFNVGLILAVVVGAMIGTICETLSCLWMYVVHVHVFVCKQICLLTSTHTHTHTHWSATPYNMHSILAVLLTTRSIALLRRACFKVLFQGALLLTLC
jgi:hypothetical protein